MQLLSNQEVKQYIDKQLEAYFAHRIALAQSITPGYVELLSVMQKFILRGGKRLRPYLAYLAYVGCGGKNVKQFLPATLSLELLHNFLLIHDDIIDQDDMRYGGPNILGHYRGIYKQASSRLAKLLPEHLALIAGDINHMFCYENLTSCKLSSETKINLINIITDMSFYVMAGQQMDFTNAHQKQITLNNLVDTYRYKAGIYTIEAPMRFGAEAAQAKIDFSKFAEPLGIAFQLKDDLLGIFGNVEQTGKPIGGDIRENKQTILMFQTIKMASPQDKQALLSFLGKNITQENLKTVQNIIVRSGGKEYTEKMSRSYFKNAKSALLQLPLESSVKQSLDELSDSLANRQK
jgi:geranylgeranyl pyrophosphate synthase